MQFIRMPCLKIVTLNKCLNCHSYSQPLFCPPNPGLWNTTNALQCNAWEIVPSPLSSKRLHHGFHTRLSTSTGHDKARTLSSDHIGLVGRYQFRPHWYNGLLWPGRLRRFVLLSFAYPHPVSRRLCPVNALQRYCSCHWSVQIICLPWAQYPG